MDREEDVPGFEIAMDDAALVRGLQRLAALQQDRAGGLEGQSLPARHEVVERSPRQELHHEIVAAFRGDREIEDLEDVVVPDEIDRAGLVEEALHDLAVARVLRVQELDGDARADDGMLGEVDRSHPALPEEPLQPVGPDDAAEERIPGAREEHAEVESSLPLAVKAAGMSIG